MRDPRDFRERLRACLLGFLLLATGCKTAQPKGDSQLAQHVSPPAANATQVAAAQPPSATLTPVAPAAVAPAPSRPAVQLASAVQDQGAQTPARSPPAGASAERARADAQEEIPAGLIESERVAGQLDLPSAVALSYRLQPRLRVYMESIAQARANSDIAFSPYLPTLTGGVSGGGFNLNVSGQSPGFSFLLPGGSFPIGLNLSSGFAIEDIRMQWLICDFGRRAGRYNQAEIGVAIAQLQTNRAYQTVANEVCLAYYQELRADSLQVIAKEAVRRSVDDLDVAQKLYQQGAIEREKVLRAQVQLAQSQRLLDNAESAAAISVAALNLAIGLDVNSPTKALIVDQVPPMPGSLVDCLQTAISQRRELAVAQRGVQAAQAGERVARADFAPKIIGDAGYLNFQQGSPQADIGLATGFIRLEWGLFEGRRRVGEVRVADSKTRAAMALANSIANTISFQINEAYRQLIAARKGIDRAIPAVEQARENYRLVRARSVQGDATSAEITDAEAALTRAEQDHMNSIYDYLSALARLEYAMGVSAQEFAATNGSKICRAPPNSRDPVADQASKAEARQTAAAAQMAN